MDESGKKIQILIYIFIAIFLAGLKLTYDFSFRRGAMAGQKEWSNQIIKAVVQNGRIKLEIPSIKGEKVEVFLIPQGMTSEELNSKLYGGI